MTQHSVISTVGEILHAQAQQDYSAIAEVQEVLNAANAGAVCRPGIAKLQGCSECGKCRSIFPLTSCVHAVVPLVGMTIAGHNARSNVFKYLK